MRLKDPRLWIAIVSAGAVLTLGVVDTQRVSPGAVTAVHGRVSDIEDGQNCSICHGGWGTSMTSACAECHEPISQQIDQSRGLHGSLPADVVPQNCALCHSEHHGPDYSMVNALTFSLAGIPDVDEFDHARIGWEMAGGHLELQCTECHEHADSAPLPAGALRFLGLAKDCSTCHDDPHEGAMRTSCIECHSQDAFDAQHSLGHEAHLPLVGGHAGLDCRACHEKDTPQALEATYRRGSRSSARACADCHESPHASAFEADVAARLELPRAVSCVACHAHEDPSWSTIGEDLDIALHAASGFSLTAPHAELSCGACHATPDAPVSYTHLTLPTILLV